jgi:hypothetical protein
MTWRWNVRKQIYFGDDEDFLRFHWETEIVT